MPNLSGTVGALEKEQRDQQLDLIDVEPEPDQTIEMLMSDLDPDVMDIFTRTACADAAEATKVKLKLYIFPYIIFRYN